MIAVDSENISDGFVDCAWFVLVDEIGCALYDPVGYLVSHHLQRRKVDVVSESEISPAHSIVLRPICILLRNSEYLNHGAITVEARPPELALK